ncbi:MAG TPA: MATE family efflux transporter [Candidatus Eubacterium avistercoris]|uniref:Multidrug export protein MepA n=1 Tax=Candidatus Eubacterium avistercoris TaxID=2838567 RepID=A0A9D2IGJ5_9FIRM|nr:MATE family efflux transporter [Candidatus Eubacterium avistercoris]
MNRIENKNDFSKGSITKTLLGLAIPMTLAQLVNVLYNVIDRIYLSRIQGASMDALTGVGVCLPVITMIIAFANLIGTGGAPLFSIERGRQNTKEAGEIMGNCLTLLLIFSGCLTVIGLIIQEPLLRLLGASDRTLPYASQYLTIYLFGTVFVLVSLGLNSFINAQGFGKIGLFTVLIGAGINMGLDPVFIFGLHMDVRGAAIATVISQGVAALWTLSFLTGKKALIRLELRNMKMKAARTGKILMLGLSGFTMSVTNSVVQMVCNATLQTFGGDIYVGIMTIINSIREVISAPITGLTNAGQPIMGYNYGAGEYIRVKKTIRVLTMIAIAYTMAIWAVVSVFPEAFIHLFSQDEQVKLLGRSAIHIYFFGFFMMAFQFCGQCTFTALGKAKRAVFFSLFRKIVIVVPLTLLLPGLFGMGVNGVFWAEPVSNAIGGLACFITMMLTIYRKLGKEEV